MQHITILGATGSIGDSTLDVIAQHPDRFKVFALTAFRNLDKLAALVAKYAPTIVVVPDDVARSALLEKLAPNACEVMTGVEALCEVASHDQVTTVVAAIVGAAGLPATLAAAKAGKRVLLANKEALVMSGQLFMDAARSSGATLLPVDSEHNAVFQSLPREYQLGAPDSLRACGVERIVLTASGGPFRTTPLERLRHVTPEQAVAHPNWVMGRKISVDSATMMNKGLEVIEAHWLFAAPRSKLDVVIHPQSVIHSMVEYADGSVIAQLGSPDMRTPIANALAYPHRVAAGVKRLNLIETGTLTFEAADLERFPCLRLAFEALEAEGTAAATLNAANEIAVEAFLAGELSYLGIAHVCDEVLQSQGTASAYSLEQIYAADIEARALARKLVVRTKQAA
jgi:1-deoxy-D-xylulose-5-phosphate reductoisomerase